MDNNFTNPILFLIFKRLDTTIKVFNAIRKVKPSRLYIACDGARSNQEGESKKIQTVKNYVLDNIDWDCEVKTLFRDTNLGCRVAVSTAIEWFFDHEEEGIILEDDCLPDQTFFPYAQELLSRYKKDSRIMAITGYHFHDYSANSPDSYFFSRYNHCWGWATWKRAWKLYDWEMSQWQTLKDTNWLLTVGDGNRLFQNYWTEKFESAYQGKVDSWAYRWVFSCWSQNGLGIMPYKNLVQNIGFGNDGTNTKNDNNKLANFSSQSMGFPLYHPVSVVRNYDLDLWTDKNHYGNNMVNALKKEIKKLLKNY